MKEPSRAPAYATLYPGLCHIAREHGYTLAIHGSLIDDLDLIAIPWIDEAVDSDTLLEAIRHHCELCFDYSTPAEHWKPEVKPHGRTAWKLFLDFGASVDLSIMQRGTK